MFLILSCAFEHFMEFAHYKFPIIIIIIIIIIISLMWVLNFNCSSVVTPSKLRHSEVSMVFRRKCNRILLSVQLCFKVIVWYLLRFPFSRLLAYYSESLLALLIRLVLAIFGSPVVSYIWWSISFTSSSLPTVSVKVQSQI